MPATYIEIDAILKAAGLEISETNREQMAVFLDAMTIFQERNARYGDLWKEYGWRGNLLHVQSKAARVRRVWWDGHRIQVPDLGTAVDHLQSDLDDAYDLLNYTVFFIRNVEDGNELGRH